MYTGLIGPSPFVAAILILLFLSKGFSKVAKASVVNKVIAVPWGFYIFALSQNNENITAVLISSLFQIFFVYWYLQISYYLEDRFMVDLVFMIVGIFILSFLNVLIYSISFALLN
ncbi:hypothetical protein K8R62_04485 [bacterium]|nr:hypothetical protein [bacterium]